MKRYNSLIKGLLKKRFVFQESPGSGEATTEVKKVSESGQARNLIRQKAINLLKDPNLKKEDRDALKKALDASTKTEVARDKVAASETAGDLLNKLRELGKGEDTFSAYEKKALGGEKGIEEREAAKQLKAKKLKQATEAKKGLPALEKDYDAKLGTVRELEKSLTSAYSSLDKQNKAYDLALGTFNNWAGTTPMTDQVRTEMKFQRDRMEGIKIGINTLKTAIDITATAYKNAVNEHDQSVKAMRNKEDEVRDLEREAGVKELTNQRTLDRITLPDHFPSQDAAKVAFADIPSLPDLPAAPRREKPMA